MSLVMDPAGKEVRALQSVTNWHGKRVLEMGCGDGRLTLRLAALGPRSIEALDPDPERIRLARKNKPELYGKHISYHVGHAESLKYPPGTFDVVVFSWVL
jgi:ubiquinone/menaquinone biosynthesis C-methylase UbiE